MPRVVKGNCAMMRLKRYHVWNFRSVDDSGPIEVDDVTALIGTNESGKTNLLLPLWKLNPAKDGAIIPMADFPRKKFNDYRNLKKKPTFIEGIFNVPGEARQKLAALTGFVEEMFAEVKCWKSLDGTLFVSFISAEVQRELASQEVVGVLENARKELDAATPLKGSWS